MYPNQAVRGSSAWGSSNGEPSPARAARSVWTFEGEAAEECGGPFAITVTAASPPARRPSRLQDATACSFWFSAATFAATSGGASAYPWNFSRWVPRPWVMEWSVVEYL